MEDASYVAVKCINGEKLMKSTLRAKIWKWSNLSGFRLDISFDLISQNKKLPWMMIRDERPINKNQVPMESLSMPKEDVVVEKKICQADVMKKFYYAES